MKIITIGRTSLLACAAAVAAGTASPAEAQSVSESARVLEALQKLDARLAAIEARLDRKTADQAKAEVHAIRKELGQPGTPAVRQPSEAYAADPGFGVRGGTTALPAPRWAGFYVGASAGSTWLHGKHDRTRTFSETSIDREFNSLGLDNEITSVRTQDDVVRLRGRETEAVFTATGGYNFLVDNFWVLGLQTEVSGNLGSALLKGEATTTRRENNRRTFPALGGDEFFSESSDREPAQAKLTNDWTSSVMARVGVLATPEWQVYGLAGWSIGGFELQERFEGGPVPTTLHGFTYGVGVERDFGWLRLFTQFKGINYGSDTVRTGGPTSADSRDDFGFGAFRTNTREGEDREVHKLKADSYSLTAGLVVPLDWR